MLVFFTILKQIYLRCLIYRRLNRLERFKIDGIRRKHKLNPIYTYWEGFLDVICFPFSFVVSTIIDLYERIITSIGSREKKKRRRGQMRRVFQNLTPENKLLRKVLYFTFGLFLSYLAFLFFYYQHFLNNYYLIGLTFAFIALFAVIAPFKESLLCLILIALPSMFSSNVRYVLVALIFFTLYFEVMPNIWSNGKDGIDSFACSVWQTGKGGKKMVGFMFQDIKDFAKDIKRQTKQIIDNMKKHLKLFDLNIKMPTLNLKSICNDPTDKDVYKCEDSLTGFTIKNNRVFPPFICTILWSGFADFCQGVNKKMHQMYNESRKELIEMIEKVERELYFDVELNHEYDYHYNTTQQFLDVLKRVGVEFFEIHWLLPYLSSLLNIKFFFLLIFSLWIVVNSILYRFRYLRSDPFDNTYITEELVKIDQMRAEAGKQTLLPLNLDEKRLFISVFDPMMTQIEFQRFFSGISLFSFTFVHMLVYVFGDYSVYKLVEWYNTIIDLLSDFLAPASLSVQYSGDSFFAQRLNRLNDGLDVKKKIVDRLQECKSTPLKPDRETYKQLIIYLAIIILTLFSSAYGLRLRHYFAGIFYPNRPAIRAVWLYNNILSRRGNFFQYLRQKARKNVFGENNKEDVPFLERMCAQWPIVRLVCTVLGLYGKHKYCQNCGLKVMIDGSDQSVRCAFNCGAIYCFDCLEDRNNICSVCMNPIDLAIIGDISEELDSSEEEINYDLNIEDFLYQYADETQVGTTTTTDPDEIDLSSYQRKDLVALAYRYDGVDPVPKVVYLVDDEGYDAEDESEAPEDYQKYLFNLEQELGIPAEKILQMKQNAKELVAEDMDQWFTNKAKEEKYSQLKRENDQRLVRNALMMVNRDRRKYSKKFNTKLN